MSSTPNSDLRNWKVIQIWDTEVPDEIWKAIKAEQRLPKNEGYVYGLMWDDALFYHGEDGWCLNDSTLEIAETWLEEHRKFHGLGEREAFWFKIGIS